MRLATVAFMVLGLVACGGRSRVHFTAPERVSAAQRVSVVAGAWMREKASDGTRREREDWSISAVRTLHDVARSELERRGFTVSIESGPDVPPLLVRISAVIDALNVRAYGLSGHDEVLEQGEYVVGGVEPLLDRVGADLLFVVLAGSEVVRWKIWGGSSSVHGFVCLALVDRDGRVIWFNSTPPLDEDMRNGKVLRRAVPNLLKELPRRRASESGQRGSTAPVDTRISSRRAHRPGV